MRYQPIIVGQRFGRLVVVGQAPSAGSQRYAAATCDCGAEGVLVRFRYLTSGHTTSCGCWRAQSLILTRTKHGQYHMPGYCAWMAMHRRCADARDSHYEDYGGRGITVCARWSGVDGFTSFTDDNGQRPKGRTLDRIDNNGGYWCGRAECSECGPLGRKPNCRWATQSQQLRNTRSSRLVEAFGVTLSLIEWAESTGINYHTLHWRLSHGWTVEAALRTRPVPHRA